MSLNKARLESKAHILQLLCRLNMGLIEKCPIHHKKFNLQILKYQKKESPILL